ncbi:threonine ammonia-lyase [Parasphingorhabdus halotolerans]|uniref:Pyridoxal-phosphate dependent enzyme n=1 Tax=Parasphingorhabdus halotolerans TaxID=2725558 RepID=A0A6H2DIT5_9SPHN|nr:pyridoxal-phosphate dependent enzyme [Parasphingorhabdus halotolerans]QJB68300.1 pyridoxal-phosphate dependent enzyme [Parasphingorhabdus halotolerans]
MTEQRLLERLLDPARKPTLAGVERAARKISDILPPTPLLPLEIGDKTILCKAECLQPIGAFKIRGGWHRLTDLDEQQRSRGVIAFSSGNHAQGVAWAAKRLGIAATVVMPTDAPKAKMENTKALGARVITYDRLSESRENIAAKLSAETGGTVVPSFDDPWVVEGQGSCGIELRYQMIAQTGGEPDNIIVCCGGGGLATGTALANPNAKITVVEPEGWDDMARSLELGHIVPVKENPPATQCDALQTLEVSSITFDILYERGIHGVSVTQAEVHIAMRLAFEKLRVVVEPGGAVALAAAIAGKIDTTTRTVVTLSGGNVDAELFAKIISG